MDTERPSSPRPQVLPGLEYSPYDRESPAPRVQKFRHRYRKHIALFILTFLSTTFCAAFNTLWGDWPQGAFWSTFVAGFTWKAFVTGLWGSLPLLTILSAHEFGHYFACRIHNVDATLPYYLPAPIPLTGTVGAVIKIREPFPSKRALFDIGVAGPIAGFVALVPFLIWGLTLSTVVPVNSMGDTAFFGEPLLFRILGKLQFGAIPEGFTVLVHPMGFGAWWGMLATALNLMPFGQLDGGHVIYSLVGRKAAYVSLITLATVVGLTIYSMSWLVTAIMMMAMAVFLGLHHPRVVDEEQPLDMRRKIVAGLALVIFILCFTPAPVMFIWRK